MGNGHGVSFLTKKVFATIPSNNGEKNQFSPMEYHWVYQPHSRADSMPGNRLSTKQTSCFYFCLFNLFWFWFCFYGETEVGRIGTGKNLGRIEERENLIKMYCMRKKLAKFF